MKLFFRGINLDSIETYKDYWRLAAQKSSDYSTGVLFCWEAAMGYEVAFEPDEQLAWIRQTKPEAAFLAPMGRWNHPDWPEIIRARFDGQAEFILVPEKLVDIWRSQFSEDEMEVIDDRGSWEYLHRVADLATLSGNKYMRKRNRINQFVKLNPHTYTPIDEALVPRIADFQREWCESYKIFGAKGIVEESDGIAANILANWGRMPQLFGGAIEVGHEPGKIIAYTIAEDAGDGTMMIHFEKASLEYNAAYQVINQEFLKHAGEPFEIVNREEDMNDPGLRDAKLSYHPIDYVKKYTVRMSL